MSAGGTNSSERFVRLPTTGPPSAILVADDDWLVADSLAMILKQHGYHVRTVYSGEEAVQAATEMCPDFLISDVCMYGISGIDAAQLICDRLPACKVILTSGHIEAEDLLEAARHEGQEYECLRKPFHPDVLLRRLQASL